MKLQQLLPFLFIFLLFLPGALAECPQGDPFCTTNPTPTVTVTYQEEDAPIILQTYELFDPSGNPVLDENNNPVFDIDAVSYVYPGHDLNGYSGSFPIGDRYVFSVSKFLPTGTYTIELEGEKYDDRGPGKEHTTTFQLRVEAETMIIHVSEPRIPFINPVENQDLAIGSTNDFRLTIDTEHPSICTIRRESNVPSQGLDQLFTWRPNFFNDNNQVPSLTHSIQVQDQSIYTDSNTVLSVAGPFDYSSFKQKSNYLIICQQDTASGFEYHAKILYIGYDDTPPVLDVSFDPTLLEDSNDLETLLTVSSQNDFLSCSYYFSEQPGIVIAGKELPFLDRPFVSSIDSIEDFETILSETFIMHEGLQNGAFNYLIGEPYDFTAQITCENPAQLSSTTSATFTVQLDDSLGLTLVNEDLTLYDPLLPYYESPSPTLEVSSNLLAVCEYTYEGTTEFVSGEESRNHIFTVQDDQDTYDTSVEMTCELASPSGSKFFTETLPFVIDSNSPSTPQFTPASFTCDGSVSVEVLTAENTYFTDPYGLGDKVKYQYKLYENSAELGSGESDFVRDGLLLDETLFDTPVSLVYDTFYAWEVIAIDGSGKQSSPGQIQIERLHQNNPRCDTQAPTAQHNAILSTSGYEVRVDCVDPEGNCASNFRFAQLPLGSSCDGVQLEESPLGSPVLISQDSTFCYQVYDTALPTPQESQVYEAAITPGVNIELVNPPSGVSEERQFVLTARTQSEDNRLLDCKHGPVSQTVDDLFSQGNYQGIYELSFLRSFDSSNGQEHNFVFDAASESLFDETAATDIEDWVIACKEQSAEVYPVRMIQLGFDTTEPVITLEVNPTLVENPLQMETTLIATTDDDAFCEYRDVINEPSLWNAFPDAIFERYDTYSTGFVDLITYQDIDVFDVTQEVRCYNLAGTPATATIDYRVEAQGTITVNLDMQDYYAQDYIYIEANSPGQWATCSVSLDGSDFVEFNGRTGLQSLDYVHEHHLTAVHGPHDVTVRCEAWFNSELGFASKSFIVDTLAPTFGVTVKDPTCSPDTVEMIFSVSGTGSPLIDSSYEIQSPSGEVISTGNNPELFTVINNLPLVLGDYYTVVLRAEDTVGYTAFNSSQFLAATSENVQCDAIDPEGSHSVTDIYGGVEIDITCSDVGTGCANNYYYYFDPTGACGSTDPEIIQQGFYNELPLFSQSSSTLCYFVVDNSGNPSEEYSASFSVQESCYNGIHDTNEDGVDCGGTCPLQDCSICQNGQWDEPWEQGVDCGYVCAPYCDAGGTVPFSIELVNPQFGVSPDKEFTFEINTNRQASCRYGKYNPDLSLSYQQLYEQMRSFDYEQQFTANFNGQQHTLDFIGDDFSQDPQTDSYFQEVIIICNEFDSYWPRIVPYFGYDTTPPIMTLLATPNPVTDPSIMESLLSVTTDDLAVCKYTDRTDGSLTFFAGEDYFNQDTYRSSHEQYLNYWASDAFLDVQSITCTNLAGTTSYGDITIDVQPEYSQQITIFNDGQLYSSPSGEVLLEVETSLYASCQYRLSQSDPYVDLDMVNEFLGGTLLSTNLATRHEKRIFVQDGEHQVEVKCNMLYDWFGSEEVQAASFRHDATAPQLEVSFFDQTCSLDQLRFDILVQDETTTVVDLQYSLSVQGQELVGFTSLPQPWSSTFEPFIELSSFAGDFITATFRAVDEAGNTQEELLTARITDSTDPLCDDIPPTLTSSITPVWGGFSLSVNCTDNPGGSGCDDYYGFTFSEDAECGSLFEPWLLSQAQLLDETGTICYRVKDLRPNYSPVEQQSITVNNNCYNYEWDPGEEGVDCGGVCDISCDVIDDMCMNGVQDNFEEGIDCGGVCPNSCGGSGDSCQNGVQDSGEEGVDCGPICGNTCEIDPPVGPLEIVLVSPEFGVAATKDFTLEVVTNKPAQCREGFISLSHPTQLNEWYDRLTDFDTTGDITHLSNFNSAKISRSGEDPEANAYPWVIICQDEEGAYKDLQLPHVGYDTTPANLEVFITPNPVINPGDISAQVSVNSDDPVVCTYLNKHGESQYFIGESPDDLFSYTQVRSTAVSYEGPDQTDYEQLISCRNIAQVESNYNETVRIRLENEVSITILTGQYHNDPTITFEVETTPDALCEYKLLDDGPVERFATTGTSSHSTTLFGLNEGDNEILVTCQNLGTGFIGSAYGLLTVDTQAPEIIVEGSSPSCSLSEVSARVFVDDQTTGVETFTYDVLHQGQVVASGTVNDDEIVETLGLTPGDVYTIDVQATDFVGQQASASTQILATDENHPDCDFIAPQLTVTTQEVWGGVEASLTCTDGESGCDDKFNYYLDTQCGLDFTNYNLGYYSLDNPLFIENSGSLCTTAYDNAGNPSSEVETPITIINHCFNGFEDPIEQGVDCGGPCSASCNTCFNGVQDPFEEGVDCGGVCETIATCGPGGDPQPQDFDITLVEPTFGISSSKEITLQVATSRDASCKHGYLADIDVTLEERYTLLTDFTTTGSTAHSTLVIASETDQLDHTIDDDETSWIVVCKEGNNYYSKGIPRFGFDVTLPVLTVTFIPNPVTDPADMTSTVTVSSDDEVVCTYLDKDDNTVYFGGNDVGDSTTYTTQHTANIRYWGYTEPTHEQRITCRNIAQQSVQDFTTLVVQADNTLELSLPMQSIYDTNAVSLQADTQVAATCQYQFEDSFKTFVQTGQTTHRETTTLSDGEYDFTVLCESTGLGLAATDTASFIVDTTPPLVEIILPQESCSLNGVSFTILADGTGSSISNVSYQITDGLDILAQGESTSMTIQESLSLDEGQTYYVSVSATDEAGHESQQSASFVARTPGDAVCDTTAPEGFATSSVEWDGTQVDISCTDSESGCTPFFGYADDSNGQCSDSLGLGYYSTSLPLTYIDPTTLCYAVYDEAGNSDSGTLVIDVDRQCFNGFEDPDEEGLDCGGVCPQACLTCNNGVQDLYEEGIDCGGICTNQCPGVGDLAIELVNPIFGLANEKNFLLEVATSIPAQCRQGFNSDLGFDIEEQYQSLENFDTTGDLSHSKEIIASQEQALNQLLNKAITQWIVICQANGVYKQLSIDEFGYDVTPPLINIEATPNPVVNPGLMRTELVVQSDDDVVCTYLDENGESVYFEGNNVGVRSSYDTLHRTVISYWGKVDYDDEQIVRCRNVAQSSAEEELNIRVDPINDITLTFDMNDYYNTGSITLVADTVHLSYCSYSTTPAGPAIPFDVTGEQEHRKDVFFAEGEHTVEVYCTSRETGGLGLAVQTFTVDSIAPEVTLIMPERSCSLSELELTALADGTGSPIIAYSYELLHGISVLESGTSDTAELQVSLNNAQENEVYDLFVTVTDSANNTRTVSDSFLASRLDQSLCDTDRPSASAQVEYGYDTADVTIFCEDEESGCSEYYGYFLDADSCSSEAYELANYYTQNPFAVDQTSTACYRVYDQANNYDSGSIDVIIENRCFNGFEDPDEEGVDCGGPCSASCGTCFNGIQDQYEEGVDCGGVCETIQACYVEEDPLDITLLTPRFGIATAKDFELSVRTNSAAICKQGFEASISARPDTDEAWFETLEDFSSTGGTIHSVQIGASTTTSLDEGADEDQANWVVLCQDQGEYSHLSFDLGFDVTPPTLTLSAEPNPILDPGSMKTLLTARSDDPVVCTYLDPQRETIYFEGDDVNQGDSYAPDHSVILSYWGKLDYEEEQIVTCRNIAQATVEDSLIITVDAQNEIDFTINNEEFYTTSSILLDVSTTQLATCGYLFDDETIFASFNEQDSTTHTRLVSLDQGTHTLVVTCEQSSTGSVGTLAHDITVDYTTPAIDILVAPQSCDLTGVDATIFADGTFSEIASLTYELRDGSTTLSSGEAEVELRIDTPLTAGTTYTLFVTAVDEAGNSFTSQESFSASGSQDPSCDDISPIGSVSTEITWQGAASTINCIDEESGCADSYFAYYDEGSSCDETQYEYKSLSFDNPLLRERSGLLCYSVYDNANNKFSDNELIEVEQKCFNGFEDPDEEGVDCGGPCDASCDLCTNGVQDSYEEGVDCGGICALSCEQEITPQPFAIEITNPRFGISSTKDFVFEVSTTQQAQCRQGFLAPARPSTVENWFATLQPFSSSTGLIHSIPLRASEIDLLNEGLDEDETMWVVICQKGEEYLVEELTPFGFDVTKAVLEVSATPNPVVDPGNRISTLTIRSDDPVACTYVDQQGETIYFEGNDVTRPGSYDDEHTATLEYWGDTNFIHNSVVSCRNIAQQTSEESYTITVDLTDNVGITINTQEVQNSKSVVINASTLQLATCQFRLDEDDDYEDFTLFNTYSHTRRWTLEEGEQELEVYCVSGGTGLPGVAYKDILVDTKDPEVELNLPSESCSLDDITFSVLADGTGTDVEDVNYIITQDDEELVDRDTDDTEITVSLDLDEGEVYEVEVTVYDEAGNSATKRDTFRASPFDPLTCDNEDPEAKVNVVPVWNGYDVSVDCEDNGDCTDDYEFQYSDDGLCQESYTTVNYISGQPLRVTSSTTFCYKVYDEAGNSESGSVDIEVIAYCFNGREDPQETGVDCGGTCAASCGTCNNGVQDSYEQGIDCGGVCETFLSCSDVAGLYVDPEKDTDGDGLPDDWELYYFGNLDEDGEGDYDGDGLTNYEEWVAQTDPTQIDSDGDGLPDDWEVFYFGNDEPGATDDNDGDGLINIIEYELGLDPTVNDVIDTDSDGLADQWEEYYFGNLDEEGPGDYDNDGLTNLEEFLEGTDPTQFTDRQECQTSIDCDFGYVCTYDYTCVPDEPDEDLFRGVDEGTNLVGIILIILGVVFMGGGAGFIYYWRDQKAHQKRKLSAKEKAAQQAALQARQERANRERLAALKKRQEAQSKVKKERTDARKKERESLMGSFDAPKEEPKTTTPTTQAPAKKKPSKLDDGISADYVDVRDLGRKSAEHTKRSVPRNVVKESTKEIFSNLEKVAQGKATAKPLKKKAAAKKTIKK